MRSPIFLDELYFTSPNSKFAKPGIVYIEGGHFDQLACILPRRLGRILAVSLWTRAQQIPRCHSGQGIGLFLGKVLWLSRWPYDDVCVSYLTNGKYAWNQTIERNSPQTKIVQQRHKSEIQNPKIYSFRKWNDTFGHELEFVKCDYKYLAIMMMRWEQIWISAVFGVGGLSQAWMVPSPLHWTCCLFLLNSKL